jgi:hypothetical protein
MTMTDAETLKCSHESHSAVNATAQRNELLLLLLLLLLLPS